MTLFILVCVGMWFVSIAIIITIVDDWYLVDGPKDLIYHTVIGLLWPVALPLFIFTAIFNGILNGVRTIMETIEKRRER